MVQDFVLIWQELSNIADQWLLQVVIDHLRAG
jgi:hypothetical protein